MLVKDSLCPFAEISIFSFISCMSGLLKQLSLILLNHSFTEVCKKRLTPLVIFLVSFRNTFNHPPNSLPPSLTLFLSSVRFLSNISSSTTFGSEELFNLDLFAGQPPPCAAWHRRSVSVLPCGAQWKSLTHLEGGPQWKKWCLTRGLRWTANVVFLEGSTLFRYFVFAGQYAHTGASGAQTREDEFWKFIIRDLHLSQWNVRVSGEWCLFYNEIKRKWLISCLCSHRSELNIMEVVLYWVLWAERVCEASCGWSFDR